MLKADAYNHGAIEVARYITKDIDWFGVANLEEAVALRHSGIDNPILVSVFSKSDSENIVKYDLVPLIYNESQAKMLDYYAKIYNRSVNIHIKIDTGMNRLGVKTIEEYNNLYNCILSLDNLIIQGIGTHYYGNQTESIAQQYERFNKIIGNFREEIIYHTASSAAMFIDKSTHYNMVRVGIAAYGYSEYNVNLQPVMHILSSVIAIKEMKKGEISGYNAFVANEDTKVAIIRGGYYDGITRDMVGGSVIINNVLCKIVAVCMDMSIIDIRNYNISVDDEVIVMGSISRHQNNAFIIAKHLNTIPYEVLTKFKGRIKRIFYE